MNFKQTEYTRNTDGESHLLCPICSFEYVHLLGVTQSTHEGRMAATLDFECEEGHKFSYRIHNHKGYTLSTLHKEEENVNP